MMRAFGLHTNYIISLLDTKKKRAAAAIFHFNFTEELPTHRIYAHASEMCTLESPNRLVYEYECNSKPSRMIEGCKRSAENLFEAFYFLFLFEKVFSPLTLLAAFLFSATFRISHRQHSLSDIKYS